MRPGSQRSVLLAAVVTLVACVAMLVVSSRFCDSVERDSLTERAIPRPRPMALRAKVFAGVGEGHAREPGSVVLGGHGNTVTSLAFGPHGQRVATGAVHGPAAVWSVDGSGKPVELIGHRGAVEAIAFDDSGERLATVSEDGTARVWSATSGGPSILAGRLEPRRFGTSVSSLEAVAFAPDGSRIVVGARLVYVHSSLCDAAA